MIGPFMSTPALPPRAIPPAAFAQAAAELRPLVRAVVASILRESREHPDVEDCTHEVLRRALEGGSRLRDGEALRPWVTGIARHVALDAIRSRRRDRARRGADIAGQTDDDNSGIDRVADDGPSPLERVTAAEQSRTIHRALASLPEGQREALRLFHLEGLAYPDIARRLDIPLGTVATWISRARKAMAAAIPLERSIP